MLCQSVIALAQEVELLLRQVLDANELVASVLGREDQLVQLEMHGL